MKIIIFIAITKINYSRNNSSKGNNTQRQAFIGLILLINNKEKIKIKIYKLNPSIPLQISLKIVLEHLKNYLMTRIIVPKILTRCLKQK
jgi:hypothetical protein